MLRRGRAHLRHSDRRSGHTDRSHSVQPRPKRVYGRLRPDSDGADPVTT